MFRNLLDSWLFVGDLLVCLFISLESFNNLCIPSILNLHENDGSMPCVCVCVLVTHSCPALWDTMDCSPPGSSFYGILKARILEWVVIPFSRGSSWPRDWTLVSCTADRLSSEPPEKPKYASVELFLIHCSVILDGSQMFFSSRKISCFLFWKYPPPHMFLFPVTRAIFSQMLQSWTDIYSSPLFSHVSYFVIF